MSKSRRVGMWILGLGAIGLLGGAAVAQIAVQVQIQPGIPVPLPVDDGAVPKKDGQKTSQFSAVKLIENSQYRQYINVARDSIKDKAWESAVTALQVILDTQEDFYVQVREKDNQGREVLRWTSVKFEAQNLLGSMPDEGLDVYEQRFGGKAMLALKQARETGDRELLAAVAHKWFHTKAGAEANDLLATSLLDRGQYFLAALRFERSLKLPAERYKTSDLTLFKTALAYRRAGETKKAGIMWERFEDKLRDRDVIRVGDQTIALAKLRVLFNDDKQPISFSLYDWPMLRGNHANSAQANGSPPLMDQPLWKRGLLLDNDPLINEPRYHEYERAVKAQLDTVCNATGNNVILPGVFPISAGGRLVFRAYGELRCVALSNEGPDIKPGDTLWRSSDMDGSLNQILQQKKDTASDLRDIVQQQWLNQYINFPGLTGLANFVFENTTTGTITTDHQNVYAIDDLAIPSPDNLFQVNPFMGIQRPNIPSKIRPYIMQNCLYAFNLQQGNAVWSLGSFNPKDPKDEFTDSHFLGAPISIGGKLYVLNEKHQGEQGDAELRLVCIDPNRIEKGRPAIVQPIQVLGNIDQRNRVTHAMSRRVNGVHLAYSEGILVCPTNAGEVLGVDLMSRSLAWAYPYRERSPEERINGNPNIINRPFINPGVPSNLATTVTLAKWKSTPPAVVDGKIVFTAPDADSVHCINLHDGTPRWKMIRLEGDLLFGGIVNKKVLIVGKNQVRALNLDDGRQAWSITTGDFPSGQGVASNGIYYQPLKKGEILAIDVDRGSIKAHNRSKNTNFAPGNLMFSDGAVLTVTPYEVVAYPQLLAKLEVADAAVKKDPSNAEKLVVRGEILLADGQVQRAVNDLHLALEQKLPEALSVRAKNRLYDALTDLMQADFPAASEKYLDEYQQLCQLGDTPREKQLRQAKYFRIVGHGREAQGNLIEAFQMYKEFGSLPIHREMQGVAALDDPSHKVPVDVWLRGRVASMFAKATPEQRAPLEAKIAEEWKAVEATKDVDAIRAFVGMFDVAFNVGREARLQLANTILDRNDQASFLEAEMNLYQLRGTELGRQAASGGRALAGLAHLEEKRGTAESMQAASVYYRQLAREFPNEKVRQAKTGRDLFDELAADKRLLPYLEESSAFWSQAPLASRELNGVGIQAPVANQQVQINVLHPEGSVSPFIRRHRLVLETNINGLAPKLSFVDLGTGKNRWGPLTLGGHPMNVQMAHLYQANQFNQNANPNARFRFFQSVGRLAVVQVGVTVYCIDAEQGRILWQQSLLDNTAMQNPLGHSQLQLDGEGNLEMIIWNQNGQQRARQPVGQVGAVQANYVAIVGSQGLQVIDPLRGNVLWKKTDVHAGSRVFGDDQNLFVVETGEAGTIASTRVLRASDGEPVAAPAFTSEYQSRIRIDGRRILTRGPNRNQGALRLYDPLTGKDVWSKPMEDKASLLATEDPSLTGWIDPTGRAVVLDASTGAELLNTSVLQGRIGLDDVANLREPLLLADADRFYFALNRPVDASKVGGGIVANNFQNGVRCRAVNGFVVALYRNDGTVKRGAKTAEAVKGQLAWHSAMPVEHQMVVTEQFDQLPILLFTARYNRVLQGGANSWVANTMAVHKQTGKMTYVSGQRPALNNFLAHFVTLQTDPRQGTINLIGHSYSVQFFVDDGRKVDAPTGLTQTSALTPGMSTDIPIANPPVIVRPRPIIRQVPLPVVPPAENDR